MAPVSPSVPRAHARNADTGAQVAAVGVGSAGAASINGTDQENACYKGIKVVVDITALAGTAPTVTVTIEGKDQASGKYYTLLASAALSATGTVILTVYPGVTVTANVSASDVLPKTWRVRTAGGGTITNASFTVGATLIV